MLNIKCYWDYIAIEAFEWPAGTKRFPSNTQLGHGRMTTQKLPKGGWDSYIQILQTQRFPMKDDRPSTPRPATTEQALIFESSLGIHHVCIIASSIYGQDNSCLVASLEHLGDKARGIVYLDPAVFIVEELYRLHAADVRGLPLILWTTRVCFDQVRRAAAAQRLGATDDCLNGAIRERRVDPFGPLGSSRHRSFRMPKSGHCRQRADRLSPTVRLAALVQECLY